MTIWAMVSIAYRIWPQYIFIDAGGRTMRCTEVALGALLN